MKIAYLIKSKLGLGYKVFEQDGTKTTQSGYMDYEKALILLRSAEARGYQEKGIVHEADLE